MSWELSPVRIILFQQQFMWTYLQFKHQPFFSCFKCGILVSFQCLLRLTHYSYESFHFSDFVCSPFCFKNWNNKHSKTYVSNTWFPWPTRYFLRFILNTHKFAKLIFLATLYTVDSGTFALSDKVCAGHFLMAQLKKMLSFQ